MYFYDRQDAGIKLGNLLAEKYNGQETAVFALPRGGVVIGVKVARALHAPLDIIITRKIAHPSQPELAIAAISEDGKLVSDVKNFENINPLWLHYAITKEHDEAKRRRVKYVGEKKPISLKTKVAIIVDDGIATGLTMRAAILQLKEKHPKKIIVAVPIAPQDTAEVIKNEVDNFISLNEKEYKFLGSVGAYYQEFFPVEDNEVISLLEDYRKEYSHIIQLKYSSRAFI